MTELGGGSLTLGKVYSQRILSPVDSMAYRVSFRRWSVLVDHTIGSLSHSLSTMSQSSMLASTY